MKKIISALILIAILSPLALAQQPAQEKKILVTESFLLEVERVTAERDSLKRQLEIKDAQLANKDEQIRALNALREIEQFRADSWMKAAKERETANALDEKTIRSFERSIFNYKEEVGRVRAERDSARRSRWIFAIGGAALGFALGRR